MELRRIGHHIIRDAGNIGKITGDMAFRIDETGPDIHHGQPIVPYNTDLNDPPFPEIKFSPAGFYVDDCKQILFIILGLRLLFAF
jgi:hypothetical protein